MDLSETDLLQVGERVIILERAFNVRQGLTRADDTLCDRYLNDPVPDGPAKGEMLDLEPMLDEYYEARGWESTTDYPTRSKLEELGLRDVADELDGLGRLAG